MKEAMELPVEASESLAEGSAYVCSAGVEVLEEEGQYLTAVLMEEVWKVPYGSPYSLKL